MNDQRIRSSRWTLDRIRAGLDWRLKQWRQQSVTVQRLRWLHDARPRVVNARGIKIRVGYHLSPAVAQAIAEDRYETYELELLRPILRADDRVIELGTGIGFLAAFCAIVIGSSRVRTFEPNLRMERHIRETFRLNGVSPELIMAAVGSRAGTTALHVSADFWTSSTVGVIGRSHAVTVPVRAFNDEVLRFRPTVAVIDIEGGEADLLPVADLTGIRAIVLEMHPQISGAKRVEIAEEALLNAGFVRWAVSGNCAAFGRL